MIDFGIDIWGDENFTIDGENLKVNYLSKPSLIDIVKCSIKSKNLNGPILLLFPHLIKKQIKKLFDSFANSMQNISYEGNFKAVFPLKVNQSKDFIESLMDVSKEYNYGLEAGSKAELILAMRFCPKNRPIIVNGFKDKELIKMVFLAKTLGYDITIVIEGTNELDLIIQTANKSNLSIPNIGFRIRLHSLGLGNWAKSGGMDSKFGLTSTELLESISILKNNKLLNSLKMVHFHIGSQIDKIAPFKKALKEIGNIYAELRRMGAVYLDSINIGGGLSVEYSQHKNSIQKDYTVTEFCNDVVYLIKEIAVKKGVKDPDILIESGRFISASHAVFVTKTIELFSDDVKKSKLNLKPQNPPLIEELNYLYKNINKDNAREYLHDSIDHLESLLTLFDLGYIDLQDRSNAEILANLLMKKSIKLLKGGYYSDLKSIKEILKEKYLLNFSIFQSMPDLWAIGQNFPIIPLTKLDETPVRNASICDITCDSDGEIESKDNKTIFLHDVDLDKEDYYIGFFLVGAYQESLSMKHNLFSKPNSVVVEIDNNGFKLKNITPSNTIFKVLYDIGYDIDEIKNYLYNIVENRINIDKTDKNSIKKNIYKFLKTNSYLGY